MAQVSMLSDEWLSKYGLPENFNASVTCTRTGTGTWTTGVTAIALCTSCSRAKNLIDLNAQMANSSERGCNCFKCMLHYSPFYSSLPFEHIGQSSLYVNRDSRFCIKDH